VSGWAALLERFGTMGLGDCLAPAIATAEEGFPVSELISGGWQRSRRSSRKILKRPGCTCLRRNRARFTASQTWPAPA